MTLRVRSTERITVRPLIPDAASVYVPSYPPVPVRLLRGTPLLASVSLAGQLLATPRRPEDCQGGSF